MRENATLTYKQIKELINKMKYDKGDYYLTENENVTITTLANKYGGVWEKLDENICLMSSNSDKTSNTNEFVVDESNIKEVDTHGNGGHSHTTTIEGWKGTGTTGVGVDTNKDKFGDYTYTSSYENSHEHKIGSATPTSIKLTNILKRPKLFIFRKIAD